jgi:hypothetical protein
LFLQCWSKLQHSKNLLGQAVAVVSGITDYGLRITDYE